MKKIGININSNSDVTTFGNLCPVLRKNNYKVIFFVNGNKKIKPLYNPSLHPEHFQKIQYDELILYNNESDLFHKIIQSRVIAIFVQETIFYSFQKRNFKIFNVVHSVDNTHLGAVEAGVIDMSFVGYEKYGEYLGWNKKDYIALGLPKYDIISSLNAKEIKNKYKLPQKYILILVPNNNLLNAYVIYKIIKKIQANGYEVVLKGKVPKCHKKIYKFMTKKYFLSDLSFYPFITHELIFVSNGVVGFDTTAVEEILMCERPFVNFSVKPYRDRLSKEGNFKQFVPMWNAPYCLDIPFFDHGGFGIFKKIPDFLYHLIILRYITCK